MEKVPVEWTPLSRQKGAGFKMVAGRAAARRCPEAHLQFLTTEKGYLAYIELERGPRNGRTHVLGLSWLTSTEVLSCKKHFSGRAKRTLTTPRGRGFNAD